MRTMTPVARHATQRPIAAVRTSAFSSKSSSIRRSAGGNPTFASPTRHSDAIVIRRRPVRPFFGARERIAVLTLIAALAVSVHVGDRLADAVQQVGLFGDTPVTNFAIDAPGG